MAITREDLWKASSPRVNTQGFAVDSEGNLIRYPQTAEEEEYFNENHRYFPASRLLFLDKLFESEDDAKKAKGRKLLNGVSFYNAFTGEDGKSFPAGTPYDGEFEQALGEMGAMPSEDILLYADGDNPELIEKDIRKAIKKVDMDRAARKAFKEVKKRNKDILDGVSGKIDNDDDDGEEDEEDDRWSFYDVKGFKM